MPGESYRRRLWFLLLYSCDVVRATVISLIKMVDSSVMVRVAANVIINYYCKKQVHIAAVSHYVTVEFMATWY